jgi:RHS repeat-associated protein
VRLRATQSFRDISNAVIRSEELFLDGFGRARWIHSDSLESGPAIVETAYDAFGRPSAQSQPRFQGGLVYATTYTRDLIGRVTQINAPISESQTSGRITGFAYEGRDLKVTDPMGNTTTRRSNVIGRLRWVVDPAPGGTTSYAYKPFGELGSISDAAAVPNVTSWTYSVRGFMTGTTDPDSGTWAYESNAFGEMEKIRDAKTAYPNWTTLFTFDKLGRPETRTDVPESLITTWNWGTSAASKNIGSLESITMSAGGYAEYFAYDSLGRILQQRVDADGGSYYFNVTYAQTTGLLERLKYPISTGGEAGRFELQHQYANGLLKRVQQYGGGTVFWEAVSTDAFGQIKDELFGNGVRTITDFDRASGLMTYREGGIGGGTGLIHSQVDWDLNGNLTQRQDLKLSPQVTETFEYDALNRFDRSLRNGGQNFDVALDPIGNITSRQVNADPVQSYDYTNPQAGCSYYSYAQPRAVRKVGTTVYCYDPNGNMTQRAGSAISYTSYNLPSVINAPGNYSSTISYGAFRNRYKQVAIGPQGSETTIYVAGLLEKVTNGTGTHYRHLIQGGNGTAAIHSRTVGGSNATFYLHRDHLGSPELITDSSGNELVRPSFAAYGERRDGTDWDGPIGSGDLNTLAGISRRGFTGHEHLDAVGLIHMNGRVFEPIAGRFLSQDPFIDGLFSSQGPNGHAYVHNNPLTYIDPSGFLCGQMGEDHMCGIGIAYPRPEVFGPSLWDALRERNLAREDFQERRAARTNAPTPGEIPPVPDAMGAMHGIDAVSTVNGFFLSATFTTQLGTPFTDEEPAALAELRRRYLEWRQMEDRLWEASLPQGPFGGALEKIGWGRRAREHGMFVFQSKSGQLKFQTVTASDYTRNSIRGNIDIPHGYELIAVFHTHPWAHGSGPLGGLMRGPSSGIPGPMNDDVDTALRYPGAFHYIRALGHRSRPYPYETYYYGVRAGFP